MLSLSLFAVCLLSSPSSHHPHHSSKVSGSASSSSPLAPPFAACLNQAISISGPCLSFSCSAPPSPLRRRVGVTVSLLPPSLNAPRLRRDPIIDVSIVARSRATWLICPFYLPSTGAVYAPPNPTPGSPPFGTPLFGKPTGVCGCIVAGRLSS